MTKQQLKKWRKRREHVNARRKAANRAKNDHGKSLPTDINPLLAVTSNTRSRQPRQMSAFEAYMTRFAMMLRHQRAGMLLFAAVIAALAAACTPIY